MFVPRIILANTAILVSGFIFMFSLVPQIILNFKLRSTKALSDIFILASLNGQFAYLCYSFTQNLPLIYKIINPIYTFFVLLIVFQRFYYSKNGFKNRKILWLYILNLIILFIIIFLIYKGFVALGYLLGWIPSGIGLWKKVPQILKVYREKSVYGFSRFFILLSLVSYSFEMCGGLLLNLPVPILFNNFRGIFVNLIFVLQFYIYK